MSKIQFSPVLVEAVNVVWDYIGDDAAHLVEENQEAVEMCIDADRLTNCGDDSGAAQAELDELVELYGYEQVLEDLARTVSLY